MMATLEQGNDIFRSQEVHAKHKLLDYLEPDLPVNVIRDLLGYIRRFAALFSGGVPVEGAMDGVGFCATEQDSGAVRVHWGQVGRQRIPLDATV